MKKACGDIIVHSCTSQSYSGLERYVLELALWQKNQNLDVVLFCRQNTPLQEKAAENGISTWTIPQDWRVSPVLWLRIYFQWRRFLKSHSKSVVWHLHHAGELRIHWPWLKGKRIQKSILQFHLWIHHKKKDLYHQWLYRKVQEIWCSSSSAKAQLLNILPIDEEKLRIVPYGRDLNFLTSLNRDSAKKKLREEWKIPVDGILAVCVSRFEKIKGVKELLQGFLSAAARFPQGHLLLVGGASPESKEAEQYLKEIDFILESMDPQVRLRIHLSGYLPDSTSAIAGGDFYVLPSYEECMSLALLDALALGLPVIGTNAGGTPSVVISGQTGVLVPPADAMALGAALESIFARPLMRDRLSMGALEMGSHFDREKIFQEIVTYYELN